IGTAIGRLRLVNNIEDESEDDIEANDIVVLKEVPLSLPPVAGVITTRPSTVLSHVNVLAKGWGIPNIYVHDAFESLAQYDRQWVKLEAQAEGYTITPTQKAALTPLGPKPKALHAARLDVAELQTLAQMRKSAQAYCGSKAATLGEIEYQRVHGQLPNIANVPDGFCIPYAHYAHFMARPDVRARIKAALASEGFERSRVVRRQALQALRNDLVAMPQDETAALWGEQWKTQLAGAGVFVRSSSNSEDLPNWSGAGLFSTVPNVRTEQDLLRAVQTVWASVYNFEAYEVRRHAGLADSDLLMGVFVMRAVDAAASGVMITRDPFDLSHRNSAYISAKNGLGIKVVEGKKLAEQSLYDLRSNAVRRLSWSDEDSLLTLDAKGGVVEQAIEPGAKVLPDNEVRDLAKVGLRLKQLFGGVDQDIEWAIDKSGRIVMLQSRPYIEHRTP
ncbi:MAG TPA: PEP/pyruvate-binding domain-containing protein, partial [Rhodocyclaceae bacterium]|nr:PEP/pyruvate-binding domain-containing protein [Rhodocyclaceae bacterium]